MQGFEGGIEQSDSCLKRVVPLLYGLQELFFPWSGEARRELGRVRSWLLVQPQDLRKN